MNIIIKQIRNSLIRIAFYKSGDMYVVEPSLLHNLDNLVESYFESLNISLDSESVPLEIKQFIEDFNRTYDYFKHDLLVLKIPEDTFTKYLSTNIPYDEITTYLEIKKKFNYELIRLDLLRNVSNHREYHNPTPTTSTNVKTVLNHHNPFSDINITDQAFLYPSENKTYQVLQFNGGYTMSMMDHNDEQLLTLQPDFKITKTPMGHAPTRAILYDDTVSTPIQMNNVEQELLFI